MLYIDIETVAGDIDIIPHDIYGRKNRKDYVDGAALDWVTGQIICIAFKTEDTGIKVYAGPEGKILQEVSDVLRGLSKADDGKHFESNFVAETWVTFNGHKFDIPYMAMRMAKHGIRFPRPDVLKASRYSYDAHLDIYQYLTNHETVKRWAGGQTLSFFAEYFGVETIDDPITGSDIPNIWQEYIKSKSQSAKESKLKLISNHCAADVLKLERLCDKIYYSLPIVERR